MTGDRTVLSEVLETVGEPEDWTLAYQLVLAAALLDPVDRAPVLARAEKWLRANQRRWGLTGTAQIAVACDPDLALQVLDRGLLQREPVLVDTLNAAAALGPAAAPLRPRIEVLLARDQRFTDLRGGMWTIRLDDRIRQAAANALAAIEECA
ncbi:hypothetical protein BCF44_109390 [Kutzneria buriramensis]|uniref:HEAT repeat domain-containing protein n=1 Tax=Kutzneria buriramensis TaxID=1045776 RepID=A0A3E0HEZ1_9PSEU|nr:hypothetical protein BCF44_109390 [Kutzneria buriramensis]